MKEDKIDKLIKKLSKLPGFGKRSAVRSVLYLIDNRAKFDELINALATVYKEIKICSVCGNFDTQNPCSICSDVKRDNSVICVLNSVSDLWALEKSESFKGKYHVLGGLLSAIDDVTPEDLNIENLIKRIDSNVNEVILALPLTVEGKTTAFYLMDRLKDKGVKITELAHGVPIGGELEYLDEGTIVEALKSRKQI